MVLSDRVQVHPVHRQRQQVGLGPVGGPASGDDRVQHRGRVEVAHVGCGLGVEQGAGHATNLEVTTDSFGPDRRENHVVHKDIPGPVRASGVVATSLD